MYLIETCPDILNVVSILSQIMHCASELHLTVAKRVVRYIKGTSNFSVKLTRKARSSSLLASLIVIGEVPLMT